MHLWNELDTQTETIFWQLTEELKEQLTGFDLNAVNEGGQSVYRVFLGKHLLYFCLFTLFTATAKETNCTKLLCDIIVVVQKDKTTNELQKQTASSESTTLRRGWRAWKRQPETPCDRIFTLKCHLRGDWLNSIHWGGQRSGWNLSQKAGKLNLSSFLH